MCGICGIVSSKSVIDEDSVVRMQNAMIHRGPDGGGKYCDSHIAFAQRRLSIIDINGGKQPLTNEDSSLILIANGEIYNYIEIREQLRAKGHTFSTSSDCEVILHLYEEYNIACVHHLRGMFAFALWDTKSSRLILARDRIGEKPLYLYETKDSLLFASELKSLLHSGAVPFKLDPDAINLYFYYQYVPEPKTPIQRVRKLPAGHICCIDVKKWKVTEKCYWRMEDAPALIGDPATLIRKELDEISKQIIRSDVPVGVALSGGLDSGAIAALAAKEYPETMHAFSIGYPGRPPCDERKDAQQLADHLGMPFHDIELSTEDMIQSFPQMNYWRDDPIADISGYGYYAVMKLARENGVPVILQGHGGDELFWGYPWVQRAAMDSIRKSNYITKDNKTAYLQPTSPNGRSPLQLLQWISSLVGVVPSIREYQQDKRNSPNQLIFMDRTPDFQIAERDVNDIYSVEFKKLIDHNAPYHIFTLSQPWKHVDIQITRLIMQTYLLENGIAQGDRLSMASSVELRLPLMDYRLIEVVMGLRKNYSDYTFAPKTWLKMAVKDIIPRSIMNRPKRGFTPPVQEWYRALFEAYGSVLQDGILVEKGILSKKGALDLSKGSYPRGAIMPLSFKALVLEMWGQEIIQSLEKQKDRYHRLQKNLSITVPSI